MTIAPGVVGAEVITEAVGAEVMTYCLLRTLEVAISALRIPTLLPTHLLLLPIQIPQTLTYRILQTHPPLAGPHPPSPVGSLRAVLYTFPGLTRRTPTTVILLVIQAAQGM